MIKQILHICFAISLFALTACEKKEIKDVVVEEEPQLNAFGDFNDSPFEFIAGKNNCIGETYIVEDEEQGFRFWVFEFSVPKSNSIEVLKFSLIEEIPISEPNGPTPDSILYNEDDLNFSDNDSMLSAPSVLIEYSSGDNQEFQSNISSQSEESFFEIGEPKQVSVNNEDFLMVEIKYACELVNSQHSEIISLTNGRGNIAFRIQN